MSRNAQISKATNSGLRQGRFGIPAMTSSSTPAPNRPRGSFQFRLIHLFVAVTWIAVCLGAIAWLEIHFPIGVCLGVLVVAVVYDRHLTNTSRLAIALPILAYLIWCSLPIVH